jgi:hypothetical protein
VNAAAYQTGRAAVARVPFVAAATMSIERLEAGEVRVARAAVELAIGVLGFGHYRGQVWPQTSQRL